MDIQFTSVQPLVPTLPSSTLPFSFGEKAEELTVKGKGKHFIGDFLPPEELEKLQDKVQALR